MCKFWPPYGMTVRWMDRTAPDRMWVVPRPQKITERFDKDGNLIERVIEDYRR